MAANKVENMMIETTEISVPVDIFIKDSRKQLSDYFNSKTKILFVCFDYVNLTLVISVVGGSCLVYIIKFNPQLAGFNVLLFYPVAGGGHLNNMSKA